MTLVKNSQLLAKLFANLYKTMTCLLIYCQSSHYRLSTKCMLPSVCYKAANNIHMALDNNGIQIFFLVLHKNICCGTHRNHFGDVVRMSTKIFIVK